MKNVVLVNDTDSKILNVIEQGPKIEVPMSIECPEITMNKNRRILDLSFKNVGERMWETVTSDDCRLNLQYDEGYPDCAKLEMIGDDVYVRSFFKGEALDIINENYYFDDIIKQLHDNVRKERDSIIVSMSKHDAKNNVDELRSCDILKACYKTIRFLDRMLTNDGHYEIPRYFMNNEFFMFTAIMIAHAHIRTVNDPIVRGYNIRDYVLKKYIVYKFDSRHFMNMGLESYKKNASFTDLGLDMIRGILDCMSVRKELITRYMWFIEDIAHRYYENKGFDTMLRGANEYLLGTNDALPVGVFYNAVCHPSTMKKNDYSFMIPFVFPFNSEPCVQVVDNVIRNMMCNKPMLESYLDSEKYKSFIVTIKEDLK